MPVLDDTDHSSGCGMTGCRRLTALKILVNWIVGSIVWVCVD